MINMYIFILFLVFPGQMQLCFSFAGLSDVSVRRAVNPAHTYEQMEPEKNLLKPEEISISVVNKQTLQLNY